jgi:hypothetical protein
MTDSSHRAKQPTTLPVERENATGGPPLPDEIKTAIEQVLDYMEAEKADYDACLQRGESADSHIYLAVQVLANWLEKQQQQSRDDARVQQPDIASDRHEIDDSHVLLPEFIAKTIPPLYATEDVSDPTVTVKWFTPDSSWTWYVIEYEPDEQLCFGLVDGLDCELGYFSLAEIEQIRGPMGLPVERDLFWSPTPLSELYIQLERTR